MIRYFRECLNFVIFKSQETVNKLSAFAHRISAIFIPNVVKTRSMLFALVRTNDNNCSTEGPEAACGEVEAKLISTYFKTVLIPLLYARSASRFEAISDGLIKALLRFHSSEIHTFSKGPKVILRNLIKISASR